jgi:hypothetical protein
MKICLNPETKLQSLSVPGASVIAKKVALHNQEVEKANKKGYKSLDYKNPKILKVAPKGYVFSITNKLVKMVKAEVEKESVVSVSKKLKALVKWQKNSSKELLSRAKLLAKLSETFELASDKVLNFKYEGAVKKALDAVELPYEIEDNEAVNEILSKPLGSILDMLEDPRQYISDNT